MSNQQRMFNEGVETSNTIDRQFTPEFVSKTIVEMPGRQTVFLDRGNRDNQPENHGDTFTMEVRMPVIHKDNMVDGGIDANGALYLGSEWYAYDANGALDSTYKADAYMANGAMEYPAAVAAAKAAAEARVAAIGAGAKLKSGAGRIRNGANSYLVEKDALIPIPETGGQMNEVGGSSKLVSAKVTSHGANSKYTVKSHKLDSRVKLLGRTIQDLGRYRKEAQEGQARASVISASENYRMCASTTGVCPAELDSADILSYEVFEAWEQTLQNAEIPLQTTIISGASKIDTVTVDGSYLVYISKELLPTLRKIKGPDGDSVWIPVKRYPGKDGKEVFNGIHGEVGSLDGLPFRFIVVQDMPIYRGQGEEVGGAGDAGSATAQTMAYKTLNAAGDKSYYDIFPLVVVGDDCYTTLSYGWGNVTAEHVPPSRDLVNDIYKTRGGVVTQWSYGFLCYRPERIQQLACACRKDGKTT